MSSQSLESQLPVRLLENLKKTVMPQGSFQRFDRQVNAREKGLLGAAVSPALAMPKPDNSTCVRR